MDEATLKTIAAQLRKPSGENGIKVGERMNEGNLQINLNTIESLKLKAGDNILEIGMGNGFFIKNIFESNDDFHYTGCDFSELIVEEAQKLNATFIENRKAEFFHGDVNALPFENEIFDKVFTINTIYFWDPPAKALAEIARVLKQRGQLTIAIRPKSIMENYPFTKYGFTMYSKEELASLFSANNFHVTQVVEKGEPEIEIGGVKTRTATLLVQAEKL